MSNIVFPPKYTGKDIEKLVHNLLFPPKVRGNMFGHDPTVYLPTIYDGGETLMVFQDFMQNTLLLLIFKENQFK